MPLQASARRALSFLPVSSSRLLFPAPEGGYIDLHNWRRRIWRPAQARARIDPPRRIYDLRHTFATDALRAGVGVFELSRFMGTSLISIDRTYGHLARDAMAFTIATLDSYAEAVDAGGRCVDVAPGRDTRVATTEAPE